MSTSIRIKRYSIPPAATMVGANAAYAGGSFFFDHGSDGMVFRGIVLALLLGVGACATAPQAPSPPAQINATMQGDAARPAQAQGWVRSELYFGVGEES